MTTLPKVGILATGGAEGGGSGMNILLDKNIEGKIKGDVKVILTNYKNGGVQNKAIDKGFGDKVVIWDDFPKRQEDGNFSKNDLEEIKKYYLNIMKDYDLDYIFLSGWMKQVIGLPVEKVVNIHPGPVESQGYGGKGMYGSNVHKKIFEDFENGEIKRTCVTMHFVDDGIDTGPIIIQIPVELEGVKDAEVVGDRVNAVEHEIQHKITALITEGVIRYNKESEKVEITNMEEYNKMGLPSNSKIGGTIDLISENI